MQCEGTPFPRCCAVLCGSSATDRGEPMLTTGATMFPMSGVFIEDASPLVVTLKLNDMEAAAADGTGRDGTVARRQRRGLRLESWRSIKKISATQTKQTEHTQIRIN